MKNATISFAAICLLSLCVVVYAQETQELNKLQLRPDTPEFEQDVSVRLQLIDVTAIDSKGNYVTDLRKDEFTLLVNGKEVPISTFDVYYPGQRGGIEDLATSGIPDAVAPSRRIILFFDQAYSSYKGMRQARSAAIEFVRRSLSPGDQVMIMGYERGFKIYQNFTRDRDKMEQAIDKIKFLYAASNRYGNQFEMENYFNLRSYLQSLSDLALYLKEFRGRKSLIMLSEGFNQRLVYTYLSQYQKETLEAFNDSNTSIFSLDVAGLSVAGEEGGFPATEAGVINNRQDTLSVFANETGGKFYRGSNNIEELLLNIDSDISHYYVLGFKIEGELDGRFREVSVSTSRPGVKLVNRKGFFAPKPFNKMNRDQKAVQLEEGFNLTVPIREMNAEASANIFPRSDGSAVAGISIDAPLSGGPDQEMELLGYVYNKDGDLIDAFHKIFYFKTTSEGMRFRHFQTVNLESGENLIQLALRDNSSGKRFISFIDAKMPLIGKGLHASSIAFEDHPKHYLDSTQAKVRSLRKNYDVAMGEAADPIAPLTRKGVLLSASNEVSRSSNVGVIIKVTGFESNETNRNLEAKFSLRRRDGSSIKLDQGSMEILPVSGSSDAIVRSVLDFSNVPAGEYTLMASITDTESEMMVGQRAQIKVR